MLINHIERIEFDVNEVRRGTLIYAKHRTWKEGISGIVYHASEERITVMSEVYKNEWEIRYSGDGLRTVQEYKEAADES